MINEKERTPYHRWRSSKQSRMRMSRRHQTALWWLHNLRHLPAQALMPASSETNSLSPRLAYTGVQIFTPVHTNPTLSLQLASRVLTLRWSCPYEQWRGQVEFHPGVWRDNRKEREKWNRGHGGSREPSRWWRGKGRRSSCWSLRGRTVTAPSSVPPWHQVSESPRPESRLCRILEIGWHPRALYSLAEHSVRRST